MVRLLMPARILVLSFIFNMLPFILMLVTPCCLVVSCTNVGIICTLGRKKGPRGQKIAKAVPVPPPLNVVKYM